MTLKTGDIIQNRYRIVRLVGQGGFGAVYRAWDVNVSQPVALKENLGDEAEAQRQFEREATLLAGLRHPNLPRVTDHFIVPGQGQYLVMDYVEGRSLAALLTERCGAAPSVSPSSPIRNEPAGTSSWLVRGTPPGGPAVGARVGTTVAVAGSVTVGATAAVGAVIASAVSWPPAAIITGSVAAGVGASSKGSRRG